MISEEKMLHILNLMMTGLESGGFVSYPKGREEASKEAKKVCLSHILHVNAAGDMARQKISSQKNPPLEGSPQWDVLYHKYFDEELKRRGG